MVALKSARVAREILDARGDHIRLGVQVTFMSRYSEKRAPRALCTPRHSVVVMVVVMVVGVNVVVVVVVVVVLQVVVHPYPEDYVAVWVMIAVTYSPWVDSASRT